VLRKLNPIHCFCVVLAFWTMATGTAVAQKAPLTANDVIERIQKNVGVSWPANTVDTFKAGDPNTPVTGVATTMMATFDVLKQAAAAGTNLVITHEPTFYGHLDKLDDLEKEKDPVFLAKEEFIKQHHLVVWRFHDQWHRRSPDGIETGMIKALGWEKYKNPQDDHLFTMPGTTVNALASDIKHKLNIRTMRVVGNPDLQITKVGLRPGASGFASQRALFQRDDVEAMVIGEGAEWEIVEYAADAVSEGKRKALLILGHIPSEQAGMEECAAWLKGFVTEVPVKFIPAKEPFWAPR
jgi:putative NIF3 family GTP cyclohydrolase 1 type 2